ncbi:hypothetical protein UPYG_G00019090 [Umbra pygmaea]|uniref:Integrin beta n=1 Tax=Umbra pygmaea TaxID=75934 RepID=A0ABD0XML0_UMBPY
MGIAVLLVLIFQHWINTVEGACFVGSARTCDECLQLDPRCAWCSQENFTDSFLTSERCDTPEVLLKRGCPQKQVEFPVTSSEVRQDQPLGKKSGKANSTHISPQKVSLKLRPGSEVTFQIRVQQTEDYPVDIYYLMDLSASMLDDLKKIKDFGTKLSEEMAKLTSKFRLGLGLFVEKPVLPFIKITPAELKNPCSNEDYICLPTFGYKNILPLTTNMDQFNNIIANQQVSANNDVPECGFDAIMQAAVCGDKIGWRNDSMRLLVFVTDADSHFGMDSKMSGIVIPNDGECHLDSNNEYSMANHQEYPTLGLLIDKLVENNILLIFAVMANQKRNYENYANFIPGATVGVLEADSRNVLELIVTAYKELRSEIEVEVLGHTEDLHISMTAICQGGTVRPGQKQCSNVKAGDTVSFNITLKLSECVDGPRHFLIKPVGFQDTLEVDLESLCTCACHQTPQPNSSHCSHGRGALECGICVCDPGYMGSRCECTEDNDQIGNCKTSDATELCSGQGECYCGQCVCQPSSFGRVYGAYCECNDFSCVRFHGELCGGHGDCDCGVCACQSGWTGEHCNCSSSVAGCVSGDGELCSGRGKCVCGTCVCSVPGASGETCEQCPTCGDTCSSARACVECHLQAEEGSREECAQRCSMSHISINNSTGYNENQSTLCTLKSDTECLISFNVVTGVPRNTVYNLRMYDCPEPPDIPMIILGVSLSIVCMGTILLVAWKLLISVHDRNEVAKFKSEMAKAKWQSGTNPLFKSSTSTFKNVTYKSKGKPNVDTH